MMNLCLFYLFSFGSLCYCQNLEELTVDEVTKAIEDATAAAENYVIPTSASAYEPENSEPKDFGTFDYIIIGGGTGGSVVANRLSETDNTILLLEAGGFHSLVTDIPSLYSAVEFTEYNWGFNTTPQETACLGMVNRQCFFPRGRGVGGSSLINGILYARGFKDDFNNWAKQVQDDAWNYDNALRAFKKSEHLVYNDKEAVVEPEYHGFDGLFYDEYNIPNGPYLERWIKAHEELGMNNVDYSANKLGVSPFLFTTKNGQRWDTGRAFVEPALNRTNLKVSTYSYVTKLIFSKEDCGKLKVEGVEFSKNKTKYTVKVNKEAILCAGAIQTPQILMLSGIGPTDHLKEIGIEPLLHLEVGSILRDHPNFIGLNFKTNLSIPSRPLREDVERYLRNGTGPIADPNANKGVAFYLTSSSKSTTNPDLELCIHVANSNNVTDPRFSQKMLALTQERWDELWAHVDIPTTFFMDVLCSHSKSIGKLRLKSKNPYEFPLIDSNYLSDPDDHDINTLYEGVQMMMKIINTEAFRSINTTLQSGRVKACNQYQYLSKEYWHCAIRHLTMDDYHPVSTCLMGTNPKDAVVDSRARVYGVTNLRIADASIFPFTLAGHPNAAVVMVGDIISEFIKKDNQ